MPFYILFHLCCWTEFNSGVLCDVEVDECMSSPCQNNGLCRDEVDGYSCECVHPGFVGTHCEHIACQVSGVQWSVMSCQWVQERGE